MNGIREDIGNQKIWLAIDETTDACGRYTANVLVGALNSDAPSESHLIASKILAATNNSTITQLVLDTLSKSST